MLQVVVFHLQGNRVAGTDDVPDVVVVVSSLAACKQTEGVYDTRRDALAEHFVEGHAGVFSHIMQESRRRLLVGMPHQSHRKRMKDVRMAVTVGLPGMCRRGYAERNVYCVHFSCSLSADAGMISAHGEA